VAPFKDVLQLTIDSCSSVRNETETSGTWNSANCTAAAAQTPICVEERLALFTKPKIMHEIPLMNKININIVLFLKHYWY